MATQSRTTSAPAGAKSRNRSAHRAPAARPLQAAKRARSTGSTKASTPAAQRPQASPLTSAPPAALPRLSTGLRLLLTALRALLGRAGRIKYDERNPAADEAKRAACIGLDLLVDMLAAWGTARAARVVAHFERASGIAPPTLPSPTPAPVEPVGVIDAPFTFERLLAGAEACIVYVLHPGHLMHHRINALAAAAKMLDRTADWLVEARDRHAELSATRARLAAAGAELHNPGRGVALTHLSTAGERAADVAELDNYADRTEDRAPAAVLLANVACQANGRGVLEGLLVQGAAEVTLLSQLAAFGPVAASVHTEAWAPVLESIAARFAAAAELVRRERERPIVVTIGERSGTSTAADPTADMMLHGSERWQAGARLVLVKWAPDPATMATRITEALAKDASRRGAA